MNPRCLFPLFGPVLCHLQAAGHLEPWRRLDGELWIALDGAQYHRSQAMHCEHCAKTEQRNGEVSYSHPVVTPVVVTPAWAQVMALAPEFVEDEGL